MGRVIGIGLAGAAGLIAAVVLFYAGGFFLYAIGVIGDVGYDSDPRVYLIFSGLFTVVGVIFAPLAVTFFRSSSPE
jgi:chromate transport protein ChrA